MTETFFGDVWRRAMEQRPYCYLTSGSCEELRKAAGLFQSMSLVSSLCKKLNKVLQSLWLCGWFFAGWNFHSWNYLRETRRMSRKAHSRIPWNPKTLKTREQADEQQRANQTVRGFSASSTPGLLIWTWSSGLWRTNLPDSDLTQSL